MVFYIFHFSFIIFHFPAFLEFIAHSMTEDRPPFLRTWRNVYILLVAVFVVEVVLMYWLTVHFS